MLICLAGWLDGVLGRDFCRLIIWGIESGEPRPPSITTANERPPEGGQEFAFFLNQPWVNYVVPALNKIYPCNGSNLRYKNVWQCVARFIIAPSPAGRGEVPHIL